MSASKKLMASNSIIIPNNIIITISPSSINDIVSNMVLKNKNETSLVFLLSSGIIGSLIDAELQQINKNIVKVINTPGLDHVSYVTPEYSKFGEAKKVSTGAFYPSHTISFLFPRMITGHTHPRYLYSAVSGETTEGKTKQDISPPSFQDIYLFCTTKSPCHLVWSAECLWCMRPNPQVIEHLVKTPELIINKILSLKNTFNELNYLYGSNEETVREIIKNKHGSEVPYFNKILTDTGGNFQKTKILFYNYLFEKTFLFEEKVPLIFLTCHFYQTEINDKTLIYTGLDPQLPPIFTYNIYGLLFSGILKDNIFKGTEKVALKSHELGGTLIEAKGKHRGINVVPVKYNTPFYFLPSVGYTHKTREQIQKEYEEAVTILLDIFDESNKMEECAAGGGGGCKKNLVIGSKLLQEWYEGTPMEVVETPACAAGSGGCEGISPFPIGPAHSLPFAPSEGEIEMPRAGSAAGSGGFEGVSPFPIGPAHSLPFAPSKEEEVQMTKSGGYRKRTKRTKRSKTKKNKKSKKRITRK